MKNLQFILKRMRKVELSIILEIDKANITRWVKNKKIPLSHMVNLEIIKNDLLKEELRCQQEKTTRFILKR